MGRHYEELLRSVVRDRSQRISVLSLLTAEEELLLSGFNETKVEYAGDKTVVELFEEQVRRTPGGVAVVYEGRSMTYGELNERSNQLGSYLRGLGVGPEVLVPLCIERSIGMIIGILGIWKAGGAYVPIDPGYPEDRIRYMLEDTGSLVLVSSRASWEKAEGYWKSGRVVFLEEEAGSDRPGGGGVGDFGYLWSGPGVCDLYVGIDGTSQGGWGGAWEFESFYELYL